MNTPKRLLSLLVSCTIVIISCEKEDDIEAVPALPVNKAPIARAGADTTIILPSCYDKAKSVDLDGSKSTDPENDIDIYRWRKIIGPDGDTLLNATAAQARVVNLSPGYHKYELMVMDAARQIVRDTVAITVTAPVQAYDLDITFGSVFSFKNKLQYCGDWDYEPCPYYDVTEIEGQGNDAQLGEFRLLIKEYDDKAALNDPVVFMQISVYAADGKYLSGSGSVHLKKLIRQGGGSFNGAFHVAYTSAQLCDPTVIRNMPSLAITGRLDTATKAVNLRIRGKAYF